jgi:hypothetical protein
MILMERKPPRKRKPPVNQNKSEFLLLLKYKLQGMAPRERAGLRRRKTLRSLYPLAIERGYAAFINQHMKQIVTMSLDKLSVRLPVWIKQSENVFKVDATDEELEALLKELERGIESIFMAGGGFAAAFSYVEATAQKVFQFEKNMFMQQTNVVLGLPLNVSQDWWPEARRLWANENHRLIKSLSQEYITKLNTTLTTAFQSGWSYEETVDQIMKLSDKMTGYRARVIARDQVGKLQYAITRQQFETIGMDGYIWTSSRDERVRGNPFGIYPKAVPSHWEIDGKICKYSNPTVYSEDGRKWEPRTGLMPLVHPGQAILCRCTASPYWLPLIEEAERLL